MPRSSSGLGRRPLTAVTRVQIPYGVQRSGSCRTALVSNEAAGVISLAASFSLCTLNPPCAPGPSVLLALQLSPRPVPLGSVPCSPRLSFFVFAREILKTDNRMCFCLAVSCVLTVAFAVARRVPRHRLAIATPQTRQNQPTPKPFPRYSKATRNSLHTV